MIKIATANPPKEEKQTRRYEKLKVNFLTVGKFVNRHQLSILLTFADDIHAYTSKLQNEKMIAIIRNCQFFFLRHNYSDYAIKTLKINIWRAILNL